MSNDENKTNDSESNVSKNLKIAAIIGGAVAVYYFIVIYIPTKA